MDLPIIEAIDAVLEISGIKDKIARNERMIKLKQRFNLDDPESLAKFEDIYAYAVVAYAVDEEGRCKPRALVEFFKRKDVRDVFRSAFGQKDGIRSPTFKKAIYMFDTNIPVVAGVKTTLGAIAHNKE